MTPAADTPHAPQETASDVGAGLRPAPTAAIAAPDVAPQSLVDTDYISDRMTAFENLVAVDIEKLQSAFATAWQKIVALESTVAALERRVAEFARHANL